MTIYIYICVILDYIMSKDEEDGEDDGAVNGADKFIDEQEEAWLNY